MTAKNTQNLIGFARNSVKNGGQIFVTRAGESDSGVVSFRVYSGKAVNDEVSLTDVTKTLKSVDGADLKHRGRPRTEIVLRATPEGRVKASTVLGRQIATALYGAEGKLSVKEL